MFKSLLHGLVISLSLAIPTTASALSMSEKISLQTAMSQHIESTLIDGVVPHVFLSDGTVVDLVPTKAHPMILTFGEHFVLCTDYRDTEGRFVNVDFYVTERDGKFVVFQTEIDNRAALKRLMKFGKVAMVE